MDCHISVDFVAVLYTCVYLEIIVKKKNIEPSLWIALDSFYFNFFNKTFFCLIKKILL